MCPSHLGPFPPNGISYGLLKGELELKNKPILMVTPAQISEAAISVWYMLLIKFKENFER
jgi:hypothetical protein